MNQNEFMEVFEHIDLEIIITDSKGIFIYCNDAAVKLHNLKTSEIIGHSAYELEKKNIFNPSSTVKVLKSGKKETIIQRTFKGKYIVGTSFPVYSNGKIKYILSMSYDLSQPIKKKIESLENAVKKAQEHLNNIKKKEISCSITIQIMKTLEKLKAADVPVLFCGETGVGKTLFARKLHEMSLGSEFPFVEVNCSTIPENLFESELFGYEPGAFSGASSKGKKGLVEKAEGGILFLDEISETPIMLQAKLLTLLQDKMFYRVGGTEPKHAKFRLIAASNQNLLDLVSKGKFRNDLYYRISAFPIEIPPLRKHSEDIPLLVYEKLKRYNAIHNKYKKFDMQTMEILTNYSWPGNIRELENIVHNLVLITEEDVILPKHLPGMILNESFNNDIINMSLPDAKIELEKQMLKNAYIKCRSTVEMAKRLGISQPSVVRKLKIYKDDFNLSE